MQPILDVKNLDKTYAGGFEALKDVSLAIEPGEIFALLGPNGAGKTTLINIVCGIVSPTSGSVRVRDHDIIDEYRATRSIIGLVPQELPVETFETVWNTASFSRGLFGRPPDPEHVEKVLRSLSLWDKKDARIIDLSGGMKRRVLIAKALAHEPDLLFLDEPTAGVDVELRQDMWNVVRELRESGVTVILTTHYLEEAESLCRNIAIIDHGEIVKNTDMKSLLATLDVETFVLDLRESIGHCPKVDGMEIVVRDENTLEASLPKQKSLNTLFAELERQGIHVLSMRNKANRLEELFMALVDKGHADAEDAA